MRDNGIFALEPQFETLAERLRDAGYDTAAVVSAVVLARRHGLDQGFDRYDDDLGAGYALGTEVAERTADATTAVARAELSRLEPPFFLWVHYYDPHEEYRPPTRFADTVAGPTRLYDGEIAFVDEQLGELFSALPERTVVAVVGDHGEMLGEHGEASHGLLLFEAARRVPLILAGPGVPRGVVDSCLARTSDLFPTLLDLAGLEAPGDLDGRSLLPLDGAGRCSRISYSESFLPFFAYKWYPLRALSDGRVLYLDAPRPSLYRLDSAGSEARDLAPAEPALVRLWGERLVPAARGLWGAARRRDRAGRQPVRGAAAAAREPGLSGHRTAGGGISAELPDPRDRVGSGPTSARGRRWSSGGPLCGGSGRAAADRRGGPAQLPRALARRPVPARRRSPCRCAGAVRARRAREPSFGRAGGQHRDQPARPRARRAKPSASCATLSRSIPPRPNPRRGWLEC